MNKKKLIIGIAAVFAVLLAALAVLLSINLGKGNGDETANVSESFPAVSESGDSTSESLASTDTESTPSESSDKVTDEPSAEVSDPAVTVDPEESTESSAPATEESTENDTSAPETNEMTVDGPIAVVNGLQLIKLSAADVTYPEDGSGDEVKGVMAATFKNVMAQTLQYAKLSVTCGGEEYIFELTTIPAGDSVVVFDKSRKSAPDKLTADVTVTPVYTVYFETEPSKEEGELEITVSDGSIKVQNVSGSKITRDFSVFYKNKLDGVYMGGITYRVRVTDDLDHGESITGYASHAGDDSEIMFVQYDG